MKGIYICFVCILLDKSIPTPKQFTRALGEANISTEHEEIVLDKLEEKVDNMGEYLWELHKDTIEPFGRQ